MSDDILDLIAGWCAEEPDLELAEGTIEVAGDPPLRIDLTVDEDRILVSHAHHGEGASEGFADAARRLLTRRGSMVRGTVDSADGAVTTTIEYPIFREGINRQTFLLAVRDVAGTVDALNEAMVATPAPEAEPEPAEAAEEQVPQVESTEELPAPPTDAGADQPWAPTHAVPAEGMNAWAEPDPSQSPTAALQPRVELRVDEMRGAWAHVTGSNGWTGWVDGRRLLELDGGGGAVAAGSTPASAGFGVVQAGGLSIRLLPLLGGIALLLSALLPWESFGQGFDVKPFDLPLAVLWGEGSPSQPELGLALVIIGVAAIGLGFLPKVPRRAIVVAGLLGAACAVLFFIQLGRAADWKIGDMFDILAAGFWIAFVGGVLTSIGGRTN